MEAGGLDSDGREFVNAAEMWRDQVGEDPHSHKRTDWYRHGVGYWQDVEASVEGVLGGYGCVNDADIKCSEAFLKTLFLELFGDSGQDRHLVALDCGSGIGRVTKNLLIRYFNEVDLLEPVSHFLEAARMNLTPEGSTTDDSHRASNFYCTPLQEFTPESGRYDVIWIQWCIGHLTDDDFVSFFDRAKHGLKPGGFFILKENIAKSGFVLDKDDSSITRSDLYFKELFQRCGLHLYRIKDWESRRMIGNAKLVNGLFILHQGYFPKNGQVSSSKGLVYKDQKGFPKELFAVKMYALTTQVPKKAPTSRSKSNGNRPGVIK